MRQKRKAIGRTKPLFIASALAAGLMFCSKSNEPRQAPMPSKTPKTYESIEKPKAPVPPGLYTRHEIKIVRKGDHVLRHYFPLEKPGLFSLQVSEVGKKGVMLSGDTYIFNRSRKESLILLRYGKRIELYGSALVLKLHAQKNGPDSAIVNVSFVAGNP